MKWLLLLLMLTCTAGFAQKRPAKKAAPKPAATPAAPAPARFPVESLKVEGAQAYTEQQVLALAGIRLGQMAGKDDFDAARTRLEANGAFDTVGFRFAPAASGKGYAAAFEVSEFQPRLPVKFHELGAPERDLLAAIAAADPMATGGALAASKVSMERARAAVTAALQARKLDTNVMASVESWPKDLAIVFRATRGLPAVAEVAFEGMKAVSEKSLQEAIAGAAIGSPYTEGGFRVLLEASLRPVYEARGMLRVEFPGVQAGPAADVTGVRVRVTVSEGAAYKLGAVTVADPSPVKPEELLKAAAFRPGETANFDKINEGAETIRKALRRAGYMDAAVKLDRTLHDAEKTVDLAVRLTPGPQYQMGSLQIKGLDLSAAAELRRIWTLKPGKPFNPEYPDYFLGRVRDQGMFDGLGATAAETKVDAKTRAVDVTLKFSGAPGPAAAKPIFN